MREAKEKAKEKAKELQNKFGLLAIHVVDEIIKTYSYIDPKLNFWQEVKKELEAMK